jgi:hypothetical protein
MLSEYITISVRENPYGIEFNDINLENGGFLPETPDDKP